MKQFLYFLIGFCLIVFPIRFVYAGTPGTCYDCQGSFYVTSPGDTDVIGFYSSATLANSALAALAASAPPETYRGGGTGQINGSTGIISRCNQYISTSTIYYSRYTSWDYSHYYYAFYYPSSQPSVCETDSDNDGIPNDCDIYPDDPTPYKVRAVSYQTSDNTFNGPRIYQWMHTDRGQTYELGTKDPEKSDFLTYSSPWEDPPTTCTGIDTTPENSEPIPENNPFTTDAPTGEPSETDTDPAFQPGEVSDGTETGDPLLRDIKSNTGKIATNTDRLGDYMKELTKAVQGMDRNTAIIASGGGGQLGTAKTPKELATEAEAQSYKSSAEGLTDSSNYDGTIVEGTDYQPIPEDDLAGESWLTGFMNDNPIQDWIDASGFDTSGSVCSLSFVHPRFGNLSFSLCNFENDFALAGNILFGLCSLYGLMTIIRG